MPSTAAQLSSSSRSSLGVEPGGSWLSLLARTSLGVERVAAVMVAVSLGKVKLGAGPFRLIVQSYRSKETSGTSPLGSVQRVVTAAELKRGVRLSLVELGAASSDEPYLVAWLEAGDATLELDGRRARPGRGAVVAMARAVRGLNPVTLVLGLARKTRPSGGKRPGRETFRASRVRGSQPRDAPQRHAGHGATLAALADGVAGTGVRPREATVSVSGASGGGAILATDRPIV